MTSHLQLHAVFHLFLPLAENHSCTVFSLFKLAGKTQHWFLLLFLNRIFKVLKLAG